MMCQKLFTCLFALMVFCVQAQQPKDTLAELYKPYQSAMGILVQSKRALPQDSVVFAKEWQRLDTRLKHLSDSIAANNTTKAPIYFEYQRLIDRVTYNTHKDSLQPHINTLYGYTAKHQEALVENGPQFNKIAKCIMGVSKEDAFVESAVIAHNASLIRDLYKQLNTTAWDTKKHQDFISFFAAQYANTSNIGMAEQLYRALADLYVTKDTAQPINNFKLPETLFLKNGLQQLSGQVVAYLEKKKIIIRPEQESLFDLVYLIRTLWAYDKAHRNAYDAFVLRNPDTISDAFLSAAKRNLAFSDYFVVDENKFLDAETQQTIPRYMLVDEDGQVTHQTNNILEFYKLLYKPIEKFEKQTEAETLAFYNNKKKEIEAARQKEWELPIDASEKYSTTLEKIQVNLRGHWQDGLSVKLTPVQWSATDTVPSTIKPYLGKLEIMRKDLPIHQQVVLVTGKKQNISLLADRAFKISVNYKHNKNAQWHEALTVIDSTLMLQSNYEFILNQYPFQETDFAQQLKSNKEVIETTRQEAIQTVRNQKTRKLLERYAEKKQKLIEQGGLM